MTGSLLQLVANGAQDQYLTGNPQITFFNVVYKRHTNFAMEAISQTFDGTIEAGGKISSKISRKGDLIYNCWLDVDITTDGSTVCHGLSIIDYIELTIGNQLIDKHYYRWLHAYFSSMVNGDDTECYDTLQYIHNSSNQQQIKIPLIFWFCKNPGLALPIIALDYHNVHINFQFNNLLSKSAGTESYTLNNAKLWCNYIYLDKDERRRFKEVKHEYLIEQVQYQKDNLIPSDTRNEVTSTIELKFSHPVKYLIWYMGLNKIGDTVSSSSTNNIFLSKGQLVMNSLDRFQEQDGDYFKHTQFYQCGLSNENNNYYKKSYNYLYNTSASNGIQSIENYGTVNTHISPLYYLYSFALKPKNHQPSGTCNFSRIDKVDIILKHLCQNVTTTATSTLHMFAINYNVFRIECGMGGLAYSN